MPRSRELIGLPVYCTNTGQRLGQVLDLVCDMEREVIAGIILKEDSWLQEGKAIAFKGISYNHLRSLLVKEPLILPEKALDSFQAGLVELERLKGVKILSPEGDELGNLTDVEIDLDTGRLQNIEISGGLICDLLNGRSVIPMSMVQAVGLDAIIASPDAKIDR